ncbi:MAG: hydroxymethylglutaryl-CoA reductase, degradative [Euryarchaeota archaeon]|nr:hydroxymethylglutaryl-CoA reductase, degradative [Euryarchaeota archaeon]
MNSRISGFYKLSQDERIKKVKEFAGLDDENIEALKEKALDFGAADRMIENVLGTHEIPFGVATNFLINGRDYLIPMAIEEPSVVAAASNAAKIARKNGGFHTSTTEPVMIAQVQICNLRTPQYAKMQILEKKEEILEIANDQDPVLVKFGGGARDVEVRVFEKEKMVVVHLLVDVRDAMGANAVNTMAEAVAPFLEKITDGNIVLRIISNLATKRLARARAVFDAESLGGEKVVERILKAYNLARVDPYRAATHNKGIMNGITAVVSATCNDTRAIEAGCHAYAARNGQYTTLSHYEKNENGDLVGSIEIPTAVGVIGGATKHPVARTSLKILGVETAKELGSVLASVGLAQNIAALRALADEGIQKGHMKLHAKNIAAMAGAEGEIMDKVAEKMIEKGRIRMDIAKEILSELKK